MQLSIDEQIEKIIEDLNVLPDQVQRASIFAMNRTAEWMKGRLAKDISAEQRIKLKLIRDRIVMQRANKHNLQAQLLCNFKSVFVRDLPSIKQTSVGVLAGGVMYPHAFIATLKKGGKSGVYRRTTTKRFPVKSVTVSIFDDASRKVETLIGTEAKQVFEKRFLHEIRRATGAI
ncbi:MAG: phage tail protein [Alphaproteobacteria bacterium]|nr:phage tail protein [Alphaproteobacteria bacterium]